MVDYGAGPVLTRNFDFAIARDGDIKTDNGEVELQKDIALIIAETVDGIGLGGVGTQSFEEDLRVEVGVALTSDPRIDDVVRLNVEEDPDERNEINVDIALSTTDGPFEAVIPVTL